MAAALESLGIDRMSIEERIDLVHTIWASIAVSSERPPISDAVRAELDCRWQDHLANPDDVIPWEQVKAEALARKST